MPASLQASIGNIHGNLQWKARILSAKKSSILIGQLTTVHICNWLTKVKQIYEPGMLSCDARVLVLPAS